MNRPTKLSGIRHIALIMPNLEECEKFYIEKLGMTLLRRANEDLVYLTCGNDNLSLGRSYSGDQEALSERGSKGLDHFGFIVDSKEILQQWYGYLASAEVKMLDTPHDHNDGARSFHVKDPANNVIQLIFHPAISGQVFAKQL